MTKYGLQREPESGVLFKGQEERMREGQRDRETEKEGEEREKGRGKTPETGLLGRK